MDAKGKHAKDKDQKKRNVTRRELELHLDYQDLKQREEKHKEMLAKKDGHIEALQTNILICRNQHILEIQKVKDSFTNELSSMHELWAKSMNDRMDENIQFHLEQQSETFDTKLEELDNMSTNIKDNIGILDQKFNNVDQKFNNMDGKFDNVDRKFKHMDEKFNDVDQKFKHMDEKFDNIDQKFENIDQRADIMVEEKVKNEIKQFEVVMNPLYYDNKLIRFAEEGSSGVTFSPSGDCITCASSEGGGACLNVGITPTSGIYEWIFKYEDLEGTGDVLFGYCNGKKFPSSWDLNCKDTCLWNPENGKLYTSDIPFCHAKSTGKREGILCIE